MPAPTDYTQMSKREILFSFSLITSLFFLWGFSYGLLDVLNSHFYTIFGLTKTQTTLLQFAYFVSYLLVAPPMGIFMRRYGYKPGIHIGLGLFSFGAVMFWPSAVYEQYGMFVAFIFVCGSGLATLEVAASSYIALLGDPKYSAFRLTLAQSFNGIASVIGPLLASHTFFTGKNAYSLGTVQYVYLAMSVFGCCINIAVYFAKLPEVRQVVSIDAVEATSWKGMLKKKHTMWGALAEFAYVGSQVSLASFAIFYFTEHAGIDPPISKSLASSMFSGCQAAFTIGRFLGVFYLRYIDPAFALFVSGVGLIIFCILASMLDGIAGIVCLFITFFFEAICYPVILSLALTDLGSYAKFGAGIVTAAVSGGAVWPSMQGAVADAVSSQRSYFISLLGFVPLMSYGFGMWYVQCKNRRGHFSIWTYHPQLAIEQQPDGTDEIIEGSDQDDSKNASKIDIAHQEKA